MLRDSSQPSSARDYSGASDSGLRQATPGQGLGMTKGINHGTEGKEFTPENGATVCHTIVTWQLSPFSL